MEEAKAYMAEAYLRENLIRISQALLELETNNPSAVMGFPDDMKLRSCMTLFEAAAPEVPEFRAVLEKYFHGSRDPRTLDRLDARV